MRFFIDEKNYFLSKILDESILFNYTTSWIFYDRNEDLHIDDYFEKDNKMYSFLWAYSEDHILSKIDEWKRAFRRNEIEIPKGMKQYQKDYHLNSERKVYLDVVESDINSAEKMFKSFAAFNNAKHLTQIIVDHTVIFDDLDLTFLEDEKDDKFKKYLNLLDSEFSHAIVLNGYHHAGELIKIFVHKKKNIILKNADSIPWNLFENTYVERSFKW
ncbi:hypothetical protein [Chryseobacterium gambrini]|uniref:hypothetical protein n=1 Tax=Chryseobacterium gambrini TaxID=373672 RepID=UPI0022F39AB2|nr:hypothetical protein [Chryseobacterium gambrini]WBX99536.1 hypothetical protein PE065_09850 [Chryseobacterium gambrini]